MMPNLFTIFLAGPRIMVPMAVHQEQTTVQVLLMKIGDIYWVLTAIKQRLNQEIRILCMPRPRKGDYTGLTESRMSRLGSSPRQEKATRTNGLIGMRPYL